MTERAETVVRKYDPALDPHDDRFDPWKAEALELREALDRLSRGVYDRLDWIERDRREPDKVLANVSSVRSFLIHEAAGR